MSAGREQRESEREWDLGEKEGVKGPGRDGGGRGAQSIKCPAETFSALYEISAFFLSLLHSSSVLALRIVLFHGLSVAFHACFTAPITSPAVHCLAS